MLTLGSRKNEVLGAVSPDPPYVARVTTNSGLPPALRAQYVLHWKDTKAHFPAGYKLVLLSDPTVARNEAWTNTLRLDPNLSYLTDQDIVKVVPEQRSIQVMYRQDANINSFLLTERCNSFCLMCSQPPREIEDSYRVDDVLRTLPLIPKDTHEIMFSGGEPTLIGERFFQLLRAARNDLPRTAVHVLSNGRSFKDLEMAKRTAAIKHNDLMIGIPIYGDYSQLHDFVVQADDAFDETLRGILNLKRCGVRVEVRIVVHKQNHQRLRDIARFLARNLLFVDQVALMGLELTGFTKANLGALWVDPFDYRDELADAVLILRQFGMRALIFNHQLCVLRRDVWGSAVRSISDWKNEYLPVCGDCEVRDQCGGFFSSGTSRFSEHIRPVTSEARVTPA